MTTVLTDAVDGFIATYGAAPDSLWSAPGRVNLIGEHTDYNDGFVFPFGIDRRTAMAVRLRDDRVVRFATALGGSPVAGSIDDLSPTGATDWAAYVFGVLWAASTVVDIPADARGFDAYLASDVPVGAGLSSSAAIESVVAVAADELWGLGLDRLALATIGRKAENEAVGAPTGIMDQVAVLFAEPDAAVFLDCRSLAVEPVPLGLHDAGDLILVIDTRESHAHATGGYASRRAACERAAAAIGVPALRDATLPALEAAGLDDETFRRARHVVTENARVELAVARLREHGIAAIGDLLDASHASMRDDFEISTPALDLAVETARAAGAIGARMTGGGFGGSAIAIVPVAIADTVGDAVRAAFAAAGYIEPNVFVVVPSAGAHREDLS